MISFAYSQSQYLKVPRGSEKIGILVESLRISEFITQSEIEAAVKLRLRRNGIKYYSNISDSSGKPGGYLYINYNISQQNNDDVYGSLLIQFCMNSLSSNYKTYYGVSVWQKQLNFFIPSRYNKNQELKKDLSSIIDLFSSEYIDANDL